MNKKLSGIDAIVAENRAGARQVERGKFRLDWKRALDKIKRFQLTDPHRYVLEVIQAAVAGGATYVEIETDSDDVVCEFDGRGYGREELERLFDYLFTQDRQLEPIKQLALGVNAALGLEPKFIVVESGSARMHLTGHLDLSVEALDPPIETTRVHVRDRVSWAVVADAFRSQTAEMKLIESECWYSPVPVRVHGEDVRQAMLPADQVLVEVPLESEDVRGAVFLPRERMHETVIDFCRSGARVVRRHDQGFEHQLYVGVYAWVDCAALSRNASHSDVHQDAVYDRCLSLIGGGIREALSRLLEQYVLGDEGRRLGAIMPHLRMAAAALLPSARSAPGLPAALDALLDVPDLVALAVARPRRSSLRPFWDYFQEHQTFLYASGSFDLDARALPSRMTVAAGGEVTLLRSIFGADGEAVDEQLEQILQGQRNRREREKLAQDPVLPDSRILVKVPVQHVKHRIRGELGLVPTAADELRNGKISVTCLRGRVPLETTVVDGKLLFGAAILDSPEFEPNEAWDGIESNAAFRAIGRLLNGYALPLLRELRHAFPELPPPAPMWRTGTWTPQEDGVEATPAAAGWPTDALTRDARAHVDALLAQNKKLSKKDADWLWDWRIWHRLDGGAMTLAELEADKTNVRYVIEAPWGEGAPDGLCVLNLTKAQSHGLRRYLKGTLLSGTLGVDERRKQLREAARLARIRASNIAVAELRRQPPVLHQDNYAVIVDVPIEDGAGQVGIPRMPNASSLRYLIDGLPLVDRPFETALPVHAVVQSAAVEPNEAFDGVTEPAAERHVIAAVEAAYPELVEAFARTPWARSVAGRSLLWRYLESLRPSKKGEAIELGEELRRAPLVSTIDRGYLSLDQVAADARAGKGSVRVTSMQAFRQLSERPIFICNAGERQILGRVLGIRVKDYDRDLAREQEVLERLDAPRRSAQLVDVALAVGLEGEGIRGEIGVPMSAITAPKDERIRTLEVLRDGVMIERAPLAWHGMPLTGVVDCPELTPSPRWTSVARNAVWNRVQQAIGAAADRVVLKGCEAIASGLSTGMRRQALAHALLAFVARRFRGRDQPLPAKDDVLEGAVFTAPLFRSAGGEHEAVSLEQIVRHRRERGAVWSVVGVSGHVAPGRIIVEGEIERETLRAIFGDELVRSGDKVLERDNAAYKRRLTAAPLAPSLSTRDAMGIVSVAHEDEKLGFAIAGQLGIRRRYREEKPGLLVRIGIEGKLLCERWLKAPIRSVAHVDGRGLVPNRDWNGLGEQAQIRAIDEALRAAMWRAVTAMVETTPLTAFDPERVHACYDAIGHAPEALAERLMTLPLWRTVQGQTLTGAQLRERFWLESEGIDVVSDSLPEGVPSDNRAILRLSDEGIAALQRFPVRFSVVNQRWRRELAGQQRRRTAPRTQPALHRHVLTSIYFQEGTTSGLVGLLPPRRGAFRDQDDSSSEVRLHIDRREVVERSPELHPGLEAWINDDRLQPTRAFVDVIEDEVFAEVLEHLRRQIPELLARASEQAEVDHHDDPLRTRLCGYILERLATLQERATADPRGPEARLLAARLWRTLTPEGFRPRSTVDLLESRQAGFLARTEPSLLAPASPAGWTVLYVAPSELELVTEVFGELPDHSDKLTRMAEHRSFMSRRRVSEIRLDQVTHRGTRLWTRPLTDQGWEGEIAVLAERGSIMSVHIFAEHRPLVIHEVVAPVSAVVAVQYAELSVNESYDDIEQGEAADILVRELRSELWESIVEMATRLGDLRKSDRGRARLVILDALVQRRKSAGGGADPVLSALSEVPLLPDCAGNPWSLAAIERQVGTASGNKVAIVKPEIAKRGEPIGSRIVLALDDELWPAVDALLPIESYSERYQADLAARARMEKAPTSHRLSRKTLVREEVQGERIRGELGLALPGEDYRVALFYQGRVVEIARLEKMVGLVGSLHGDWKVNRDFTSVTLSNQHLREIEALYQERLEALIDEAAAWKGSRRSAKWEAMAAYVITYLHRRLARLGGNQRSRRDRVVTRDPNLPEPVRRALDAKVIQRADGSWTDLPSVVGGEDPTVVICSERKRRLPKTEAALIIAPAPLPELIQGLVGSRNVGSYERWTEGRRQLSAAAKRKDRENAETVHRRMGSALRSLLRETVGSSKIMSLRRISELEIAASEADELVVNEGGKLVINTEHEVFEAAASAPLGARGLEHLAVAVLTELSWLEGGFKKGEPVSQLVSLLTRLAAHASREG